MNTTRRLIYAVLSIFLVTTPACGSDKASDAAEMAAEDHTGAAVFAPGVISRYDEREFGIRMSPDGRSAYFHRYSPNQLPFLSVFRSDLIDGAWQSPEPLAFETAEIGDTFISPDGKTIVYSARKRMPADPDHPWTLWSVTMQDDHYDAPVYLGDQVNLSGDECYPSVSLDGNLLFYSSTSEGGAIFYSKFQDRHYETPRAVEGVNSQLIDTTPFLAPDESYILFSRGEPGNPLTLDIYISLRKQDGSYSEALKLNSRVNTDGAELQPYVSPDQTKLFFTRFSAKNESDADIYWIPLSETGIPIIEY